MRKNLISLLLGLFLVFSLVAGVSAEELNTVDNMNSLDNNPTNDVQITYNEVVSNSEAISIEPMEI